MGITIQTGVIEIKSQPLEKQGSAIIFLLDKKGSDMILTPLSSKCMKW